MCIHVYFMLGFKIKEYPAGLELSAGARSRKWKNVKTQTRSYICLYLHTVLSLFKLGVWSHEAFVHHLQKSQFQW